MAEPPMKWTLSDGAQAVFDRFFAEFDEGVLHVHWQGDSHTNVPPTRDVQGLFHEPLAFLCNVG